MLKSKLQKVLKDLTRALMAERISGLLHYDLDRYKYSSRRNGIRKKALFSHKTNCGLQWLDKNISSKKSSNAQKSEKEDVLKCKGGKWML